MVALDTLGFWEANALSLKLHVEAPNNLLRPELSFFISLIGVRRARPQKNMATRRKNLVTGMQRAAAEFDRDWV